MEVCFDGKDGGWKERERGSIKFDTVADRHGSLSPCLGDMITKRNQNRDMKRGT